MFQTQFDRKTGLKLFVSKAFNNVDHS